MVISPIQWDELIQTGLIPAQDTVRSGTLSDLVQQGTLSAFQACKIGQGNLLDLIIGNYVLLDKLGSGGMGSVYKAKHRRMRRISAIKILAPELMNSVEGVQRFQREIEVIARLSHPNVVMAYDAGDCNLGHFLIMEFVDGTDLHQLVAKEGRLPWAEAIGYFREAAQGLSYIHKQGLTHRDIKPANLLKAHGGGIKVSDLGLVRLHGVEEAGCGEDSTSSPLTMGISGTFDYMAPEQAEDTSVADHRADIYSLGCTLWYLLSGQHLYTARTLVMKIKSHATNPIPKIGSFAPGLGQPLENWWNRMVAKLPDHRHENLDSAVLELDKILGTAKFPPIQVAEINIPNAVHNSPQEAQTVLGGTLATETPEILLVEPSEFQRNITSKMLIELGYQKIHYAQSFAMGLECFFDFRPEILFTSFLLPDGSGLQLIERILSQCQSGPPAFVLITSDINHESQPALTAAGVTILAKPFTAKSLANALDSARGCQSREQGSTTVLDASNLGKRTVYAWAKASVLIVDDSAFARKRIRSLLSSLGARNITEACDGTDAWELLEKRSFDFITTDWQMPKMQGDELAMKIRGERLHVDAGLVMITGETELELLHRVRDSGVEEVLGKSLSDHALLLAFQRIRPQWAITP